MNIYVHFPFCRGKCAYCALLSRAGSTAEVRRAYVGRLVEELDRLEGAPRTVYFGGGTPALCELEPVLGALRRLADRRGGGRPEEFTVELHPQDVVPELLTQLAGGGVNRVSLGVQSLDDRVLTQMRRGHTAVQAEQAFRRLREVFPNAGVDLIAGWPGVTAAAWRETVDRALALEPEHLSCYTLIREPGTLIDLAVRRHELVLPDDDAALAQMDYARESLAAAGLFRYEVSNFARPGRECRHNLAVWRGEDYIGLGEGAHGRVGMRRTIGGRDGYERTEVAPREDAVERALLALRTAEGIDLECVARRWPILASTVSVWRERLETLVPPGILRRVGSDRYVPTDRGFEVADAVMQWVGFSGENGD